MRDRGRDRRRVGGGPEWSATIARAATLVNDLGNDLGIRDVGCRAWRAGYAEREAIAVIPLLNRSKSNRPTVPQVSSQRKNMMTIVATIIMYV